MNKLTYLFVVIVIVLFADTIHAQGFEWDVLKEKTKARSKVISDVTEAYKLIHNNNELNLKTLPQPTRLMLADASEAWYLELLNAIDINGQAAVFNKYNEWNNPKPFRESGLKCYNVLDAELGNLIIPIFLQIGECETRNTMCHLESFKKEVTAHYDFYTCIETTYK